MEDMLYGWIVEMHGRNLRVSLKMVQLRAKEFSAKGGFIACHGWLYCFMSRKKPSLRWRTTVCQMALADCIPKLVSFVIHLKCLQMQHEFPCANIFAMDETLCWKDIQCTFWHNSCTVRLSLRSSQNFRPWEGSFHGSPYSKKPWITCIVLYCV